MIKLSFIVPVYNVAPYLRKCVDSLLAQDYSDYEIILVDDGSTDGSGKLCDEFVSIDNRWIDDRYTIRVIHQKNGGLSAARNTGVKVAKGEYVCFVDSDDYWEENMLGGLMGQIDRDNLDVLRFDYQNVRAVDAERRDTTCLDAAHLEYKVFEPNKTPRYIDEVNEVVDGQTYLNTRMGYACYAVMYIIRRDIVPTFTEGIHYEDVDWLPRMILRAKRVNSATKVVYNYLARQGSITKTQGDKDKIRKNLEDRLLIIDRYSQYIERYPACQWLRNMQSGMWEGVLTTVAREFYSERKEYTKKFKEMNVFPLRVADQGKTFKRRALLINLLGADLYCRLIHTMHR